MFRVIACCAALVLGLGANAVAASESKPLDIMKFMKEQAANTRPASPRAAKPQQSKAPAVAQAPRPAHRAVAARAKPARLPIEAAASYATQEPRVQIVAGDELNDIDRAAPEAAAPAETTGSAVATAPNVQLVDNGAFNDIDRKAEDRLPVSTAMRIAAAHASAPQSSVPPTMSWWQWIGSALANIFMALAAAVHHLTGV